MLIGAELLLVEVGMLAQQLDKLLIFLEQELSRLARSFQVVPKPGQLPVINKYMINALKTYVF